MSIAITEAQCQRCGACCSLLIDGALIACRHLIAAAGTFRCAIYDRRPSVCRDYDCTHSGAPNPLVDGRAAAAAEVARG